MKTIRKFERVTIKFHGNSDVLTSEMVELVPNEKSGLLIEVWAIGIGFADIMAQRGGYALAPKLPFSPGYDFVGRVVEAYNSEDFKNGDFVAALLPQMGTYRDLIEVPEEFLVKLPQGISLLKTAAAVLNYLTAYCILDEKAKIKSGDTVFIQGASGGVGIALAQIGRMKGLKMYGTASQAKHPLLKQLGVIPIDYKRENFVVRIKRDFPNGLDAAFDARGGEYLLKTAQIVKKGGVVVSYGFSGNNFGGNVEVLKGLAILVRLYLTPNGKKIKICAIPGEVDKNQKWYKNTLKKIVDEIALLKLDPIVGANFTLKDASKAHKLMESGNFEGKIVLTTNYFKDL